MPNKEQTKTKTKAIHIDDLRHNEYYELQSTFDNLYADSKDNKKFENLMDIILERENILLAYRNIKTNDGSKTPGTDGLTIKEIGKLTPEEVVEKVRFIINGSKHGYRPKPVKRIEIPKQNGSKRPLGIPCIWDRLVQQCIKQVLEPICEAKFSNNSYGFRPGRSVENAISRCQNLMQLANLHYVVEFDIKGFYDNINHSKLIKQIWAMGIQDKKLIYIIRKMLLAPIKMPNGGIVIPTKGTPQGGILSPLLANIVLNELDQWVESQWQKHPVTDKYVKGIRSNGSENPGHGYRAMKQTRLKEMFNVRYADDFRIFCRTEEESERVKIAVTEWLKERLSLDISPEKTKVVNLEKKYMEFLGFKMKVHQKGNKMVVVSHVSDAQLEKQKENLKKQAKNVKKPRPGKTRTEEAYLYNAKVVGIQNYYRIATEVNKDFAKIQYEINGIFKGSTKRASVIKLTDKGRTLTPFEKQRFGKSTMLKYVDKHGTPIYPIGYVQHKNAMGRKWKECIYTEEGRAEIHNNLKINTTLMVEMMKKPTIGKSIEFSDNKISLFSAQKGKCAVTGKVFTNTEEIHCHHIIPVENNGTDEYKNLVLVLEQVHKLIHATQEDTINKYLNLLELNKEQVDKINRFRELANVEKIK